MMRTSGFFVAYLLLAVLQVGCNTPVSDDVSAIELVREESNHALAEHDSGSLAKCFTTDYNVVTSRNAVSSSRRTFLERVATDWGVKPDLVYKRMTSNIDVFEGWKMASEVGQWEGTWTEPNGDKILLKGSYYAKWHKVDGVWLIRAEVFTPLSCDGGAYCSSGPLGN